MNTEQKLKLLDLRREAMAAIRKAPEKCKVCDCCDSIAFLKAPVCPVCHSFRWRVKPEEVLEAVLEAGAGWMPKHSGYVPRLAVAR